MNPFKTDTGSANWLVPLADLSMILFVMTGAALARQPAVVPPRVEAANGRQTGFMQTVPVALWRDAPGSPPLDQWIGATGADPSGQVTVEGHFAAPEERAAVAARVEDLAQVARDAGVEPRVVVQEGPASEVVAVFAYDRDPQMAQDLLENPQH